MEATFISPFYHLLLVSSHDETLREICLICYADEVTQER